MLLQLQQPIACSIENTLYIYNIIYKKSHSIIVDHIYYIYYITTYNDCPEYGWSGYERTWLNDLSDTSLTPFVTISRKGNGNALICTTLQITPSFNFYFQLPLLLTIAINPCPLNQLDPHEIPYQLPKLIIYSSIVLSHMFLHHQIVQLCFFLYILHLIN